MYLVLVSLFNSCSSDESIVNQGKGKIGLCSMCDIFFLVVVDSSVCLCAYMWSVSGFFFGLLFLFFFAVECSVGGVVGGGGERRESSGKKRIIKKYHMTFLLVSIW